MSEEKLEGQITLHSDDFVCSECGRSAFLSIEYADGRVVCVTCIAKENGEDVPDH